jgi:hypothetical protein
VRISQFVDDTPKNFKEAIETLKRRAGGQLKGLVLAGATNAKRSAAIPYSPPMKPDIIGTPQDTQLKSAISYLQSHAP